MPSISRAESNPAAPNMRPSWPPMLRSKVENGVRSSSIRPARFCSRSGKPGLHGVRSMNSTDALRHIGERRPRNKLRPRQRVSPRNKTVFPKRFFVEEHARAELQRRIQLLIEGLIELLYINTQFRQEILGDLAVLGWTLDRLRSPVAKQLASAGLKLIALGVSAEVVMIVQNQNARLWTRPLAVKGRS